MYFCIMIDYAFVDEIFAIQNEDDFNASALKVFDFQYKNNKVYQRFVDLLQINRNNISSWQQIPCLPIELFKNQQVVSFKQPSIDFFQSSGTTSTETSKHYFFSTEIYQRSFLETFSIFWGDPSQYCIIALLPNYLHQTHSSLIFMVRELMERTQCQQSAFYDSITPELLSLLQHPEKFDKKLILFGVSYSLMDLVENYSLFLGDTIIFETGGMKGRRKEMIRKELHDLLAAGFHVSSIASEYGMTELFSQAYSKGDGIYRTPPWMKIAIRDINSPLYRLGEERIGGIDVIDLANLYSCSFISTQDMGKQYTDGSFEVQGRFDYSDVRGCNLMSAME